MWPGDSGLTVLFDDAPDPTEVQPDDPRITLVCRCSASSPDSSSRLRYGDGAPWPITMSSMVGLAAGDDWKARADGKGRAAAEFKRHRCVESGSRGAEAPGRCCVGKITRTIRSVCTGSGLGSRPFVRSRDRCRRRNPPCLERRANVRRSEDHGRPAGWAGASAAARGTGGAAHRRHAVCRDGSCAGANRGSPRSKSTSVRWVDWGTKFWPRGRFPGRSLGLDEGRPGLGRRAHGAARRGCRSSHSFSPDVKMSRSSIWADGASSSASTSPLRAVLAPRARGRVRDGLV